ncbi:MAG: type II secretion system protein [Candidatus Paceibacterota bacterium]
MKFLEKIQKEKGFTLIEMLVVVAIIGILSSVILVGLNDARSRARDAKRISDIRQIQNGLELFYSDDQSYPRGLDEIEENIPNDPQGGEYVYFRYNSQSYVLGTCLENNRPAGVGTYESNDQVGAIGGPLVPPPSCRCSDPNGYCVSIGDGGRRR